MRLSRGLEGNMDSRRPEYGGREEVRQEVTISIATLRVIGC